MRAHDEAGAAYVHVIVNERREGGASLPHTHAQLYALDFVPAQVARERERFGAYATRTMGGNLLQDLVQEEVRLRERIVAIDDEAVLHGALRLAPALPAHARAAARRARASRTTGRPAPRCCTTRWRGWRAGSATSPPLNLWVRTAPRGAEHFCWRIDIVPRLTHLAGLELGTGVHLNIVAPEHAAAELRDAWPSRDRVLPLAIARRRSGRRGRRRRERALGRAARAARCRGGVARRALLYGLCLPFITFFIDRAARAHDRASAPGSRSPTSSWRSSACWPASPARACCGCRARAPAR